MKAYAKVYQKKSDVLHFYLNFSNAIQRDIHLTRTDILNYKSLLACHRLILPFLFR